MKGSRAVQIGGAGRTLPAKLLEPRRASQPGRPVRGERIGEQMPSCLAEVSEGARLSWRVLPEGAAQVGVLSPPSALRPVSLLPWDGDPFRIKCDAVGALVALSCPALPIPWREG